MEINSSGNIAIGAGEGLDVAATGNTLRAPDIVTGGAGDVPGADITFAGGLGSGVGDPGQLIFQTPRVAGAGDNIQSLTTLLTLDEDVALFDGNVGIGAAPDIKFHVTASTANVGRFTNTATSGASGGAVMTLHSNDGVANAANDRLGGFLFTGQLDGSTASNGAGILGFTDGIWSAGDTPTRLEFEVAEDSTATRKTALTIGNDRTLTMGTTTVDTGDLVMVKGARSGDPQFTVSLKVSSIYRV